MTQNKTGLILVWLLVAASTGPVGIVLHEMGHYFAAGALGFPGLKMSYASITFANSELFWQTLASGNRAGASTLFPIEHAGIVAIAGPAVTLGLVLSSAVILALTRPTVEWVVAFYAGMALTAGIRAFTGVSYILMVRPYYPGARPFFDEINAARAFDIPVDWIVWPSVAIVVLAWIVVIPNLTPHRWTKLALAIAAPVLGIVIWAQIGPFIWP
jgi:hypothetical protein